MSRGRRRGSVLSALIVAVLALLGLLFVIDYAIGTHFSGWESWR